MALVIMMFFESGSESGAMEQAAISFLLRPSRDMFATREHRFQFFKSENPFGTLFELNRPGIISGFPVGLNEGLLALVQPPKPPK